MEPGVIKKLDETVVNRIAAGEIIQRPANALKEMLENSLDAKSSFIQISAKGGGLKYLQIQDNGTGIRKSDMDIICERFTTSKLEKFEDLSSMKTFGFRGEALASISHVAHLSIQSKTASEICAYKASYEDGKLKSPPKPCAGNQGTIITVEDIFYNMPQRKQGFKSPFEEFQKISEVVSKYAVHNANVSFILKKVNEQPALRTPVRSTQEENIKIIYGTNIAKELIPLEMEEDVYRFKLKSFITKVNYSAKKGIMLLFINNRLVESSALKTAIHSVYSTYLPKGNHPFIYMSLQLNPSNVDVNVHPTKHEVHFLYEDEIIEKIKQEIEAKLIGSNSTRTFYKQLKLPGTSNVLDKEDSAVVTSSGERVYAKDLVRTDSKEQKLEKFWTSPSTKAKIQPNESCGIISSAKKYNNIKLSSVLGMQRRIQRAASTNLNKILKSMVFVGVVNNTYSLIQFETKLFLCNTEKFSLELFYQNLIFNFENFERICLEPPLKVRDLLTIALELESSGWTEEDGPKEELAERALEILYSKSAIMREYFSLGITDNGMLESLPCLLENHIPSMAYLPQFMLRLATEVQWDTEEECFETFCRETAQFYSIIPTQQNDDKQINWIIEHCIYDGFKQTLIAEKKLENNIFELTNLPSLYKVFERC